MRDCLGQEISKGDIVSYAAGASDCIEQRIGYALDVEPFSVRIFWFLGRNLPPKFKATTVSIQDRLLRMDLRGDSEVLKELREVSKDAVGR